MSMSTYLKRKSGGKSRALFGQSSCRQRALSRQEMSSRKPLARLGCTAYAVLRQISYESPGIASLAQIWKSMLWKLAVSNRLAASLDHCEHDQGIYIYIYIYIVVYLSIYIFIYLIIYLFTLFIYTHTHVRIYLCVYIYIYIHILVSGYTTRDQECCLKDSCLDALQCEESQSKSNQHKTLCKERGLWFEEGRKCTREGTGRQGMVLKRARDLSSHALDGHSSYQDPTNKDPLSLNSENAALRYYTAH